MVLVDGAASYGAHGYMRLANDRVLHQVIRVVYLHLYKVLPESFNTTLAMVHEGEVLLPLGIVLLSLDHCTNLFVVPKLNG